jgi:hypothetical protein
MGVGLVGCGPAPVQLQDPLTYELDHKTDLPFFNNTPKMNEIVSLEVKGKKPTLELEVKLIDLKGNESEVALKAIPFTAMGGSVNTTIQIVGPLDVFRNKNLRVDHVEGDLGIETNVAKLETTTKLKYTLAPNGKSVTVTGVIPPSKTIQMLESGNKIDFKVVAKQADKDVEVKPFSIKSK